MKKIIILLVIILLWGCNKKVIVEDDADKNNNVSYSNESIESKFPDSNSEMTYIVTIDDKKFKDIIKNETQNGIKFDYEHYLYIQKIIPINNGYLAISGGVFDDIKAEVLTNFDFFVIRLDENGKMIDYDHYDNALSKEFQNVRIFLAEYIYIFSPVSYPNPIILYDYDGNYIKTINLIENASDEIVLPGHATAMNENIFIKYNSDLSCCKTVKSFEQNSLLKLNSEGEFIWEATIEGGVNGEYITYVSGLHSSLDYLYIYGYYFDEIIVAKYGEDGNLIENYNFANGEFGIPNDTFVWIKNLNQDDYIYIANKKTLQIINLHDGTYETRELPFTFAARNVVVNGFIYTIKTNDVYQYNLETGTTKRFHFSGATSDYAVFNEKMYIIIASLGGNGYEIFELPS